jgi:hypothetical protein
MPRVELEHTTPVFEQAKTVHASDRVATGIGVLNKYTHTLQECLEYLEGN